MSNASYPRAARVREAIKEVLAAEVERLKDPGVGFVTITDVSVSPDLRHAKAFYTVYGEDVERASTRDGRGGGGGSIGLPVSPTHEPPRIRSHFAASTYPR